MTALVLVVTACLTAQPGACREFPVPLMPAATLHNCQGDQVDLAAWSADHPVWTIRRWRCERGGKAGAA